MDATHDNLSIPNGSMNFRSSGCAEFTIGDLLADPLTGALMRADRVNVSELEILLGSVACRIQAAGARATDRGRESRRRAPPVDPRLCQRNVPASSFRGDHDAIVAGGGSR